MFEIQLKKNKTFTSDSKITIFEAAKSLRIFLDLILTEWDEFKTYDWTTIYKYLYKPAFIFDGRTILEVAMMQKMGF